MSKDTVENSERIDMLSFSKGKLTSGVHSTNYDLCGPVSYWFRDRGLSLNYRILHPWDDDWADMDYLVPISYVQCHFGGCRRYFVCIHCKHRTLHLYCDGKYFVCRSCASLCYKSQLKGGYAGAFDRFLSPYELVEEFKEKNRRMYYAGKPTKAYKRLIKALDASDLAASFLLKAQ